MNHVKAVLYCAQFILGASLCVPLQAAVIVVDALTDHRLEDGNCELAEAIEAAHNDSSEDGCAAGSTEQPDKIEFATDGEIHLLSRPERLTDLTLTGRGQGATIINCEAVMDECLAQRPGDATYIESLSMVGRPGETPIVVGGSGVLELDRVKIDGGSAIEIRSTAELNLIRTTLVNFLTSPPLKRRIPSLGLSGPTRGGQRVEGGALRIFGTATITDSTIANCVAMTISTENSPFGGGTDYALGGGLYFEGIELTIIGSTFSGNESRAEWAMGGGLALAAGDVSIRSSSIIGNSTVSSTPLFQGGGVDAVGIDSPFPASLSFDNTLLADNISKIPAGVVENDLFLDIDSEIETLGHNFLSSNFGAGSFFPAGQPNAAGDYVGTGSDTLEPFLGPLADNGGPTPTHLPLLDLSSLAVDTGSCALERRDQRGFYNPSTGSRAMDSPGHPDDDDGCDIGAVEALAEEPIPEVFADGFEAGDTSSWNTVVGR